MLRCVQVLQNGKHDLYPVLAYPLEKPTLLVDSVDQMHLERLLWKCDIQRTEKQSVGALARSWQGAGGQHIQPPWTARGGKLP